MEPRKNTRDYSEKKRRYIHQQYHEKKDLFNTTEIAMYLGMPPQMLYNSKKRQWWEKLDKEMAIAK